MERQCRKLFEFLLKQFIKLLFILFFFRLSLKLIRHFKFFKQRSFIIKQFQLVEFFRTVKQFQCSQQFILAVEQQFKLPLILIIRPSAQKKGGLLLLSLQLSGRPGSMH